MTIPDHPDCHASKPKSRDGLVTIHHRAQPPEHFSADCCPFAYRVLGRTCDSFGQLKYARKHGTVSWGVLRGWSLQAKTVNGPLFTLIFGYIRPTIEPSKYARKHGTRLPCPGAYFYRVLGRTRTVPWGVLLPCPGAYLGFANPLLQRTSVDLNY